MPETNRLWNTINAWWAEIEVLIITGVTNSRTEAANTTIKNIKRTGRGFRNPDNHRRVSRLPRSQLRVNTYPVDPFTSKREYEEVPRPTVQLEPVPRFVRLPYRLPDGLNSPITCHHALPWLAR